MAAFQKAKYREKFQLFPENMLTYTSLKERFLLPARTEELVYWEERPGDGDTACDELAVEAAVGAVQLDAPHRGELLDVQDVLAVNRLRLSAGTEAWLRASPITLMTPEAHTAACLRSTLS